MFRSVFIGVDYHKCKATCVELLSIILYFVSPSSLQFTFAIVETCALF